MQRLIVFLLLVSAVPGIAQSDYFITLKGDTLRGNIQILSYDAIDRISVKNTGKKKMYTAVEVRMVNLDSAAYTPMQYDNTIRLMKVLRSGYLSFYAFKLKDQNTFDGRLLVKLNGTKQEVPNMQFKKIVSEFLEDCPSIAERVKAGEFERSQVEVIVDHYNDCVKNMNQAVVMAAASSTPLTEAISVLRTKVEGSSLETRKEVVDLLATMDTKARLNDPIPAYLKDGLKSYLADKKEFEQELNKVMELLK